MQLQEKRPAKLYCGWVTLLKPEFQAATHQVVVKLKEFKTNVRCDIKK